MWFPVLKTTVLINSWRPLIHAGWGRGHQIHIPGFSKRIFHANKKKTRRGGRKRYTHLVACLSRITIEPPHLLQPGDIYYCPLIARRSPLWGRGYILKGKRSSTTSAAVVVNCGVLSHGCGHAGTAGDIGFLRRCCSRL